MTTDTGTGGSDQPAERGAGPEARCAHCGALLAPGIGWCAQCYVPIQPAQEQPVDVPGAGPSAAVGTPVWDVDTEPGQLDTMDAMVAAAWPGDGGAETEFPERGPLVQGVPDPAAAAQADKMLALLAIQTTSSGRTGRVSFASATSLMSNTGAKIAAIAAGTVVLTMLGYGLLTLLGQML